MLEYASFGKIVRQFTRKLQIESPLKTLSKVVQASNSKACMLRILYLLPRNLQEVINGPRLCKSDR